MKNAEICGFRSRFQRCPICDFFLFGLCGGSSVCPPCPANPEEHGQRISTALQTDTQDMLQRVWEELEYRIDVCRVSGGVHIVHL